MCPKMSFWLMLRLAILLTVFLVQSSEGSNAERFRRQHIDHPKTRAPNDNTYCNQMMRRRGMTRGVCKNKNTFINASSRNVQNCCGRGGRRIRGNIFECRRSFPVVECSNQGRYPRCNYIGRRRTKRVRVACVNGRPVHFQGPM